MPGLFVKVAPGSCQALISGSYFSGGGVLLALFWLCLSCT